MKTYYAETVLHILDMINFRVEMIELYSNEHALEYQKEEIEKLKATIKNYAILIKEITEKQEESA